jgi:tetratricopeptide (TPR) repeat protein
MQSTPMDQFTAHLDRGWDLVSRGDFAGALLSAKKCIEMNAESPEAHNLMGYVYAAEGSAEEALEHYRTAIDLDDTFVEAMLNAAEVLLHPLADNDAALELVEEALELIDDDQEKADALLLKADILMQKGDYDAARRVVKILPEGPFENPGLEFMMGRAQFEVGEVDAAAPRIEAAAEADPANAEAQYYLGLLREQRKDVKGSTLAFLRTRELDLRGPVPSWSLPMDQFERQVQTAIGRLAPPLERHLDGALVVVSDIPGAEVVAEGVDPRVGVLVDAPVADEVSDRRVLHVFVYQRNIERVVNGLLGIEEEILNSLTRELKAVFEPEKTAPATDVEAASKKAD